MNAMTIILTIIGSAILVLLIWNLITLRSLQNKTLRRDENLNDQKYFELKYKNEFLVAIFTVITTAAALLGYNSLKSVEASLSEDFNHKVDSTNRKIANISIQSDSLLKSFENKVGENIKQSNSRLESMDLNSKSLDGKLKKLDISISDYQKSVSDIVGAQNDIDRSFHFSKVEIDSIQGKIKELNSRNILKQNYYIVDSVIYDESKADSNGYVKMYFADLRTSIGDKLPLFKRPPFILMGSRHGANGHILNVTNESFKMGVFEYLSLESSPNSIAIPRQTMWLLIAEMPD